MPSTETIPDIKDIIPPPEIPDPDRFGILLFVVGSAILIVLLILIFLRIKSHKNNGVLSAIMIKIVIRYCHQQVTLNSRGLTNIEYVKNETC